ncbi:hypothetical protein N9X40_03240 [bacterium]|nr:hypothetical protein [bacterium]
MLQVSTLLREVIASMSVTLKIDSVEASGSNWKVYCSNTQYLNTLSELEIASVQYVVESFVQDEYLILEGAVEPTPGIFALRNPTFKHGKYQAVLTELSDPQDLDIMPLIWMLENQQRTRPSELDSKIESEGQVRLFFANTDDWSRDTEQMYEEILNPVLTLVNLFLVELEANKRTGDFGVIETTNHAKLTIGGGDLGSTEAQGIFQRTLSGIEVTINLPIMVDFDCSDTASTRVCPQVSILDANGNIITMVDAGSSYTVSGGGGSGFVENSDSSYTNTVASGATLVLPDITVTDSDGSTSSVPSVQNVLCTPSADATVENSDSSYTNTVASGATLVLPDITVTDSDGSTSSVPSVQNVLCTPSADATVENSDSSYTNTVASGGTLTLPDITVTDSDGSTFTQASVVNVVCSLAADGTVNVNSVFFDNVASGATLNIEVRQSSGSTLIGSKQGAHFRIPDSVITLDNTDGSTLSTTNVLATDASTITAPDATAVIKNTLNAVLRSELVPSNVSEDIIIADATININQSDGTLIASATVTAEGSGVYNVADSTVNVVNTLGTVLSSNSVKATVTDTVLAPDANVENSDNSYTNTVASGATLVIPDITVTYPSGATENFPAAVNITASADVSDEIFLEADSVVESGGAISVMTDQSGNQNNANQHIGSTQPTLVTSDAAYNNQPVAAFAADQMYFDRPFAAHLKDGFSFFFVGRVNTVARFDWLGSKYGNTVCSLGGFEDLGYTRIRTKELSASNKTTQNTATNLDTDGIWTLIGTGASTNLYLNGVLVISASQHQENGSFGWLGALSTQLRSRGRFGTMTFRNGYDLTQINARGSAFGTKYGFTWTTIV